MRSALITVPAAEPWVATDPELNLALRLDGGYDQAYVTAVISAARRHFERVTGLCLITQTWRAFTDTAPTGRELELPKAPLIAVTSVTYLDDDSVSATYSADNYALGGVAQPGTFGRLRLRASASWPTLGDVPDALAVTFTAGFGTAKGDVPMDIRLGLLQLIAHWYEHRLPVGPAAQAAKIPLALNAIIDSHRVANIG